MVVAAISKDIRGRSTLGSSTRHPWQCHNSRTHGSSFSTSSTSRNFRSYNSRDRTISSPTPVAAGEDHPTNSDEEERTTSVDHNVGEEISLTSSASCVSSTAKCVITMPAPMPRHHSYAASSSGARAAQYGTRAHAAQYSTGAHVAQYGTHPLPPWTSHNSDGQSTSSIYGPPPHHASFAPAQPMPPPLRSVGPPPPPAPPSDSDWSFFSGPSQALQAQYVPPGEFLGSDLTERRTYGGSVGRSYLPSVLVG